MVTGFQGTQLSHGSGWIVQLGSDIVMLIENQATQNSLMVDATWCKVAPYRMATWFIGTMVCRGA
jgi:hypothetical protein